MTQRLSSAGARLSSFVCRHPRLTVTLVLVVALVAVQGSVAAVDGDCSSCLDPGVGSTEYHGPDSKD